MTRRNAPPAQDGGVRPQRGRQPDELLDQSALADPGRPEHRDQPRSVRLDRFLQEARERLQFAIPAHHGRREAGNPSSRLGKHLHQRVRGDRFGLALQFEGDGLTEAEGVASRQEGSPSDEHRSRLGDLLEPGGHVDRVTGDDQLLGAGPHGSDDLAGVDADPDAECDPMALLEVLVQCFEPGEHLERGPKCPPRIVLPDDRDPEHRHDGVADELLDGSSP